MGPTVGEEWGKNVPFRYCPATIPKKEEPWLRSVKQGVCKHAMHVQGEWSMFASEVVCRGWQLVHARPTSQTSSLNYLPNWRLPYTHTYTPTPSYL